MTISLFMINKKEKIQWLTEFSRAIEWADAAMVIKAKHNSQVSKRNSCEKSQQDNKIAKANLIIKEIQSMEPAVIDGLSQPGNQFHCYKTFITGLVKVKVSNFESILKTCHNYPTQKLKLVLKLDGSSLFLES